ncbi:MAG: methylmalonyl-CoA mutase, partial [Planctomycetes bacterium]|nr:methylmalonyl-CoA mutase [Planctomycetota bacterium]
MNGQIDKPGEFPYTRGVHPTMYRGKPWTIRQYSGMDDANKTNERFKLLLEQGQTGLSTAFDLPTQMGLDPDDHLSKGEVGSSGVSVAIINDMENLLQGLPLDKLTLSMTINATAQILLSFLVSVAEKRGISKDFLSGTVQNDILKEYIARGCYIYPVEPAIKISVDVIEYCAKYLPSWNFISVSGYHMREAGSTAVQEVAFTLSNALCYMENAIKRGVDRTALAKRVSFFFNSHNNFFEEIAKFRAARRLWARLASERLGLPKDLCKLRFHAQTAGVTLTSKQPHNNLIRVTYQVLAAALGGAQSIHANAFDEALGLPTEDSAKLAIRTQQILQNEIGIRDVADPFGGSYVLEDLTDRIESEAVDYIKKIDGVGGAIRAVETKFYQKEIEREQIKFQKEIESGASHVVGVTKYQNDEKTTVKIRKPDLECQRHVINKFLGNKKKRDESKAEKHLSALKKTAESGANILPSTIDCCKSGVTLGEISNA